MTKDTQFPLGDKESNQETKFELPSQECVIGDICPDQLAVMTLQSAPTITMMAGSMEFKLTEDGIFINGEQKDVDKDWSNTFNQFNCILTEYNKVHYQQIMDIENTKLDLSAVLDAATGGKWSKPADRASMIAVIYEYQEELVQKALEKVKLTREKVLQAYGAAMTHPQNSYKEMDHYIAMALVEELGLNDENDKEIERLGQLLCYAGADEETIARKKAEMLAKKKSLGLIV